MRKDWLSAVLALCLAACTGGRLIQLPAQPPPQTGAASTAGPAQIPTRPPLRSRLPDLGPAPELENEVWLNTEDPLRLADLRGKVVLIDMWTFG